MKPIFIQFSFAWTFDATSHDMYCYIFQLHGRIVPTFNDAIAQEMYRVEFKGEPK